MVCHSTYITLHENEKEDKKTREMSRHVIEVSVRIFNKKLTRHKQGFKQNFLIKYFHISIF